MFTDPLMSIIDAGAKMFLEYIERVSSEVSQNCSTEVQVFSKTYMCFNNTYNLLNFKGQ